MVLTIHIGIAILSLIMSGAVAVRPVRRLLFVNYALVAVTFASGTLLIIQHPAHLAAACLSGLAYLAVAATLTFVAERQLAHQNI